MSIKLKLALKFLICVTFFVPLVVVPASYIFPFIVPKIVWFRSLTLLILGLYILLLASDWSKYRPRFTPITITVLFFLLSFSLSTFMGVDWYKSFWDNHERMLGLFTIFHYTIYYFVITSVFKEWKDWRWFLRIFLFAGSIVMFIGLLQKLNPELLLNRGSGRVSATLGNSIYFSGYGLFLMCIGYLLAAKEVNKKINPWFWYAVGGSFLGFFGIFWGGTRGTVLGLLAGIGVLAISYVITLKEHKRVRQIIAGSLIFVVVLFGIFFVYRQTNFVKNIPAVGRLVNTTLDPATPRYMAWGIAIEAWQARPVFGWGPNNYFYAFNEFYKPQFLESGYNETWFDNAHNVILNTLAVQGTVGILTYLGMFGAGIFVLWRGYKRKQVDAHLVSIGSAFLVAHLISLVTVFENPTSYLYFFFFLAFVNSQSSIFNLPASPAGRQSSPEAGKKTNERDISIGLSITVFAIVFLLIYSTDINPAKANKAALNALRALYSNPTMAVEAYNQASDIPSPHIDDIRNDFARTTGEVVNQLITNKQVDKANILFDLIYGELAKNRVLHPLDIRIHMQQAQLAFAGAQLRQDVGLLLAAEKDLFDALQLSPKRQQIQYILSGLEMQLSKPAEAIKLLQDSIDNDPKISEGWTRLLGVYQQLGDMKKAKEVAQDAIARGVVFGGQQQFVDSILQSK